MEKQKKWYPGQPDLQVTELEKAGRKISRQAAAEGMVLLHNNNGILPLTPGARLALFGIGARHTIKGGSGSGDVNSRDIISVDAGLRAAGFDIINTEYLDQLDQAYDREWNKWKDAIYKHAGPEKDAMKLYDAHVRLKCEVPQLPLPLNLCRDADAILYVLSRTSGEGADRRAEPGDYYLTDHEEGELEALCGLGRPVIVLLNVGGIIDLSFLDRMPVSALLLMGQAGCDSGAAVTSILSGEITPSGHLTDSWAFRYEDYPSSRNFSHRNGNLIEEYYTEGIYVGYRYFDTFNVPVRYPFGFGLSYTTFHTEPGMPVLEGSTVRLPVLVHNTGSCNGRHVVQLYAACPAALQMKEAKRLVAFGKTPVLLPGESATVELSFDLSALASYHAGTASWYLDAGTYTLLAGDSAKDCTVAARLALQETVRIQTVTNVCELLDALNELEPAAEQLEARNNALASEMPNAPVLPIDDAVQSMIQSLTQPVPSGIGETVLAEARKIAGELTEEEKVRLVVGLPGIHSGEVIGSAGHTVPGVAGETMSFPEHNVPSMVLADGPAGIRLQKHYEIDPVSGDVYQLNRFETFANRFFGAEETHPGAESRWQFATAIPVGTLLAQSFDPALLEEVGEAIGHELQAYGICLWLAPGMNIHRNPLCGRNFEYYSEDPLVSGIMAAAITRGVQKIPGVGTTIKHYACNNQEDNRMHVTSNLSERALREIYLKGFEIAVRTSQPVSIMTSYNRINGVHTANSYDLCTTVARQEWGFEGFIMTDWTTTNRGGGSSAAKCIRAGNDLVMPGTRNDRREITDALHHRNSQSLSQECLDSSVIRLLYAALRSKLVVHTA